MTRYSVKALVPITLISLASSIPVSGEVITVTVSSDGAGHGATCELREAIEAANTDMPVAGCAAGSGDDEIHFIDSLSLLVVESNLPPITSNVEIVGLGPLKLFIDGDDLYTLLEFDTGTIGAVRGLSLVQGFADASAAFKGACLESSGAQILVEDVRIEACEYAGSSGAPVRLEVSQSATLRRVALIGNVGTGASAIRSQSGNLIGEDLLFMGNMAPASSLGAFSLVSVATATIRRSTFTDNTSGRGSAITTTSSSTSLILEHSTVSANQTNSAIEAAVEISGTLTLFNSIIGNNFSNSATNSPDLTIGSNANLVSLGHNILGTNNGNIFGEVADSFPVGLPNFNRDWVGTTSVPVDPKLENVADIGGPTESMRPKQASPAVDQGKCPEQVADQRGFFNETTGLRPVDDPMVDGMSADNCDIGAVERGAMEMPFFVDGFESGDTLAWI